MAARRHLSRLWRRVGRRGVSLLFVGVLSAVLWMSIMFASPAQLATPAYVMLSALAPLWVWAAAWGVSAVVCWAQAFMRQDRVAFALATGMWWAYGIAWYVGTATGVNPRGWVLGSVWILFGAWLNLIATWPEAPPPPPPEVDHADRP